MAETKTKVPGAEDQLTDIGQLLVDRDGFEIGEGETIAGAVRRIIGEQDARVAELEDQLASSEASIRGYKSAATKAKRGVAGLGKREKAREVGPLGAKDAEAAAGLIAEAIAGSVQIVASDGEKELTALEPVEITGGENWRPVSGGRMMLIPGILLEPGAIDAPELEVIGFGLFAEDQQIGWCALVEPIRIARLTQVRVENTIAF